MLALNTSMSNIHDRLMERKKKEGSKPVLTAEQIGECRKAFDNRPDWDILYLFHDNSIEGPDCGLKVSGSRIEALVSINTRGIPVVIGRQHSQIE